MSDTYETIWTNGNTLVRSRLVAQVTDELLAKVGVPNYSVQVRDLGGRRLGLCSYTTRTITYHSGLLSAASFAHVFKTIAHEVAHAARPLDGHGKNWKLLCRALGGTGERCSSDREELIASGVRLRRGAYVATCPGCGREHEMFRRPRNEKSCGKCSSVFDRRYLLKWRKR